MQSNNFILDGPFVDYYSGTYDLPFSEHRKFMKRVWAAKDWKSKELRKLQVQVLAYCAIGGEKVITESGYKYSFYLYWKSKKFKVLLEWWPRNSSKSHPKRFVRVMGVPSKLGDEGMCDLKYILRHLFGVTPRMSLGHRMRDTRVDHAIDFHGVHINDYHPYVPGKHHVKRIPDDKSLPVETWYFGNTDSKNILTIYNKYLHLNRHNLDAHLSDPGHMRIESRNRKRKKNPMVRLWDEIPLPFNVRLFRKEFVPEHFYKALGVDYAHYFIRRVGNTTLQEQMMALDRNTKARVLTVLKNNYEEQFFLVDDVWSSTVQTKLHSHIENLLTSEVKYG